MAQALVHFDLYLTGCAPGVGRAELVKRIDALCRLDRADAAAFVASGARIRVRRGVDQDAAMKSILELQGVGAIVEIEPNRPPDEALAALDAIDAQPPAIDAGSVEVDALRRALRSVSGMTTIPERPVDRDCTTQPMAPSTTPSSDSLEATTKRFQSVMDVPTDPMALQSLDGSAPAIAASAAAVTIGRESTAETDPARDARFAAPDYQEQPMLLDVEAPPVAAAPAPPSPSPSIDPLPEEADVAPRCEVHDAPEPCAACAERDKVPPGRLLKGQLRQQPAVRIGLGIALGLGLGYLASMPYADRAERRVAAVRAEANADRYKNAPEAQANTAALDEKAENMSRNAAVGTIAIWLVTGAGIVAGWFRIT